MIANFNVRKNVIASILAFTTNIALTFVGYRLVVQQGGTEAIGLWASLSAAVYVIRLGDVGMGSAAERHVASTDSTREPGLARSYLDTAILLNAFLFTTLASLGWALYSWRIEWIIPGDITQMAQARALLPLMLLGFIASNLANVITGGLRGLHLGYKAAYISITGAASQLAAVLLLVPTLGVAGLAWSQLLQHSIVGILAWIFFNKHLYQTSGIHYPIAPTKGSYKKMRQLFGFSLRAQAVNLANGLIEPTSKLLVGHSGGLAVLGLFEMAYKIVSLPRNAVVAGVLGMTPAMTRMYDTNRNEVRKLYQKARKLVAFATGAVLFVVVVASPFASVALLNEVNSTLVIFTAIIAAGFWLNALGAPAYALGFAADKLSSNLFSALMSLFLVAMGSWVLGHTLPVYGPVLASAIGLASGGIFILLRNERLLQDH